jgi:hypothetical protein
MGGLDIWLHIHIFDRTAWLRYPNAQCYIRPSGQSTDAGQQFPSGAPGRLIKHRKLIIAAQSGFQQYRRLSKSPILLDAKVEILSRPALCSIRNARSGIHSIHRLHAEIGECQATLSIAHKTLFQWCVAMKSNNEVISRT